MSESFPAMGTMVLVSVEAASDSDAGPALDGARRIVHHLDHLFSRFRAASDVCGINRDAGRWVRVSDEAARLLLRCRELVRRTGGSFDPLVGAAVETWRAAERAGPGERMGPGASTAASWSGPRGEIEVDGHHVRIPRGTRLDLGAAAKGCAADRAVGECVRMGAGRALVSLGTSSLAVGPAGTRRARVGISSPYAEPSGTIGYLEFRGSVSVSGGSGVPVGAGGVASHIIDPATMRPAMSDVASVVVVGADGIECEAFSTAMVALGRDAALELGREQGVSMLLFAVDGTVLASPDLAPDFRWAPGAADALEQVRADVR